MRCEPGLTIGWTYSPTPTDRTLSQSTPYYLWLLHEGNPPNWLGVRVLNLDVEGESVLLEGVEAEVELLARLGHGNEVANLEEERTHGKNVGKNLGFRGYGGGSEGRKYKLNEGTVAKVRT